MEPLTRVTGKVFGGEAPLDQIGQFGSALAGTKVNTQDVAIIQALDAYTQGWGSAVISSRNFPPMEEVNGVLKTLSYQICYLLQEGIPEYDINTNYSAKSIVKNVASGNVSLYVSLQDNNQGNALTNTTYWSGITWANNANRDLSNLSAAGQQLFDDKVSKSGDTMAGRLIFSGANSELGVPILVKSPNIDLTATPTDVAYTYVDFADKNNTRVGVIGVQQRAGGKYGAYLQAGNAGGMGVYVDGNSVYAFAPASDVAGSVLTTTAISKAANGYVKLGNGLIIQWGNSMFRGTGTTITLPTAFTNTHYRIFMQGYAAAQNIWTIGALWTSKTTTSFTAHGYEESKVTDINCDWFAIGY